jgi:hypothetical protein
MALGEYRATSSNKTAEQCDPPNTHPRHVSCGLRFAPLAGAAPRAGIGDRGRYAKNEDLATKSTL